MTLEHDIERLALQEQRLVFTRFGAVDAWSLGCTLRDLADSRGQAVAIEIRIAGETVFFHAMPGTAPANADWARRKRNTVELLHRSSYRVSRELERDGSSLEARMGLPTRDYASHGGAFPICVDGCGVVGTVTVSGLPQREDHAMLVDVLARLCGVPPGDVALPP